MRAEAEYGIANETYLKDVEVLALENRDKVSDDKYICE